MPMLALLACAPPSPTPGDSEPLPSGVWTGKIVNGGYGSRIAVNGPAVAVSAPFAGYVHLGETVVIAGQTFSGAGLAPFGDGFLVGGAGIRTLGVDGTSAPLADGTGGTLATLGTHWAASLADGVLSDAGTLPLPERPSALAFLPDGTLVVGSCRGAAAVRIGEVTIPHDDPTDDAGYALLADGAGNVVVGAPGADEVRVYDRTGALLRTLTGEGRFGAALAWDDGLWIGAPMYGDDLRGAVYRESERRYEGDPGDQLGTAVAAQGGNVWMGAPGLAEDPGRVRIE